MTEKIKWNQVGFPTRKAVAELCGWRNRRGSATPTGIRIARTEWDDLSPASKRVLTKHGIEE